VPGRIGNKIRQVWYRSRLQASPDILHVGFGSRFVNPSSICLGINASLGERCVFNAGNGNISCGKFVSFNDHVELNSSLGGAIRIGDDCLFGPGVKVFTSNHCFEDRSTPIRKQGHSVEDVIIEDNCWIGANSIILAGVTIGAGTVIGAGAVVTANVPAGVVACGIPARVIRQR
jgi:acetyltransferase-like isoleucine patch superfamily enzyme